jgi:hypothetical protein
MDKTRETFIIVEEEEEEECSTTLNKGQRSPQAIHRNSK